ncbi:MAG: hypothetical protein GY822_06020 [Deltaproteobacteria bacterium]|nr:hypothetical protein [Deltaproteobacteria bacterium]
MATNRRGFFGRLFGKGETRQSCFAVQLVINAYGDEDLRQRIHTLLDEDIDETPMEKKRFYKRVAAVVSEAEPYFEHACFEYEDREADAESCYTEWVSEIEAEIATEDEETGSNVDGVTRLDSEQRYIVFSMIFLVNGPHPYGDKYDGENQEHYTRANLAELVDSVNYLDFDKVVGDACFLVPGNNKDGFSWSDLADEGWGHLKMITG